MKDDVTPYIRFLKAIQKPDLEGVWLDGKDCAENQLSLDENPFQKDSKEYFYWNEGWWSGFYEEEALSLTNEKVETVSKPVTLKAANDAFFIGKRALQDWVEDVSFIIGTFVTGMVCYELVDMAI